MREREKEKHKKETQDTVKVKEKEKKDGVNAGRESKRTRDTILTHFYSVVKYRCAYEHDA